MPYGGVWQIMLWRAIASLILAAIMAILVALGIRYAHHIPKNTKLFDAQPA